MGKKILVLCFDVIMIAFFPRKIQWKSIFLILNQLLGGGGGGLRFSSDGDDQMGQKSKPQKIPGPKINRQKIQCPISKP